MAKHESAFGVVTAEEPDETTPETAPESAPAPTTAPAPAEEPAEEAPTTAEANGIVYRETVVVLSESPEARRVLSQLNDLETIAMSLRSSIHFMIGVENRKGMSIGEQMYFSSVAMGMWDVQQHVRQARTVLTNQALVDDTGEIVETVAARR